jgi:hypothetical protein
MIRYKKIIVFLIPFFILFSCSTREDNIFAATDELHYIHLYQEGNEFEILYNGINTAKGTFIIIDSTILLTYNEDEDGISSNKNPSKLMHANDVLTRVLSIDVTKKKVKSIDDKSFCADIYLDKRKK